MKHNQADAILPGIFLILICVGIAPAQDLEWKPIRPGGQEFTVEMPGKPTRAGWIIPVEKDTKLAPIVYDLVVNNVRYQVMSFGRTGPVPPPQEFDSFIGNFQRAFVAGKDRMPNSITFEKNVAVDNRTVKQFQLKVGNHDGLVRFYDAEYHFYAVMVIGAIDSDAVVSRFLTSFKVSKLNRQFQDTSHSDVPQPSEPPEPWSGQLPANMAPVRGEF